MAHGVTRGSVLDGVLHLLDQLWVLGFCFLPAPTGLADSMTGRVIGQVLELPHPFLHGVRIASKDLRDVPDTTMSQFDGFNCCKAATVLFRETLIVLTQLSFDGWVVGLLKGKR